MTSQQPQTYTNHRRMDPAYHYVASALSLFVLVLSMIRLIRTPSLDAIGGFSLALSLMIILLKLRTYSLHNQDRIIRLEESLRMASLLPETLRLRVHELNPKQFVALRFASNEELPTLVDQTLREDLSGEEIKKRIQVWRPDTFRI
jgi:hypothetical protein